MDLNQKKVYMRTLQKFILEIVEIIKDFGKDKTFLALRNLSPGLFRFANINKPSTLSEAKTFADEAPWLGPLYASLARAPEIVSSPRYAAASSHTKGGDTRFAGMLPDWLPFVGGDDASASDAEQDVFITGQREPIQVDNQELEDLLYQTNELLSNLTDKIESSLAQIDLSVDDLISATTGATLADVTGGQAQMVGHRTPDTETKEPEEEPEDESRVPR